MPLSPQHPFNFQLGKPPGPTFTCQSFMLLLLGQLHVQCAPTLLRPSIHRILEPATTCSVFGRPPFLCATSTLSGLARVQDDLHTPCITCTPLYRPGPSSRSWNFVCVAQHRRRGPVKRVECIALRCNAGHALRCKERGCGIRAMQNAVFYCAESS